MFFPNKFRGKCMTTETKTNLIRRWNLRLRRWDRRRRRRARGRRQDLKLGRRPPMTITTTMRSTMKAIGQTAEAGRRKWPRMEETERKWSRRPLRERWRSITMAITNRSTIIEGSWTSPMKINGRKCRISAGVSLTPSPYYAMSSSSSKIK